MPFKGPPILYLIKATFSTIRSPLPLIWTIKGKEALPVRKAPISFCYSYTLISKGVSYPKQNVTHFSDSTFDWKHRIRLKKILSAKKLSCLVESGGKCKCTSWVEKSSWGMCKMCSISAKIPYELLFLSKNAASVLSKKFILRLTVLFHSKELHKKKLPKNDGVVIFVWLCVWGHLSILKYVIAVLAQ